MAKHFDCRKWHCFQDQGGPNNFGMAGAALLPRPPGSNFKKRRKSVSDPSFIMQLPNTFLSLRQMSLCNIALQVYNDPKVSEFRNTHDINSCIWSSDEIESLLRKETATLLNHAQVLQMLSKRRKPTLSHANKYQFNGDDNYHSISIQLFEFYVDKKLSTLLLPKMFKKEVTTLVRLVSIESYKWFQDHKQ
ncbi:hypothetical protein TNIN_41321 [Trichonephila inaurata madagascariensis]|uniref:Uncharacterized protein n=1 Tax=Trichonephila inaurata madagascariensis TaxID=2747483 RepID=A0A8X6YFA3_9ARAC|nr:hypothetical protein TNIN_41321 [Trichonephila inaurata madagascariensis]